MGMFNSALMAIPVFVVFILFASLRVAISSVTFGERIWMLPKYLSLVFLFIGCFFLYFSFRDSKANRKLSIAYSTIKGGETEKALTDLKTYRNALRNNHRFWILIGDVFQSTGKPKQAIQSYNNALKFTSNPKVFRRVSSSYRALRNYESAINSSLIASNILPYRVWTKFDLMNLYALNREFGKSRSIGNAILKQKPKGKKDIKEIKRQVRFFLQDLDKKIINNED